MSLSPCLVCGKPSSGAYCAKHQPVESEETTARRRERQRQDGRDTRAWRRLRGLAIWKADGKCQLRLEGCTGEATTVHLAERLGGDHSAATLSDLTAACLHCHGVQDGGRPVRPDLADRRPTAEREVLIA